ncbi:jouberin-like [Hylaeus volcanicus]|uniref:jouberin-like n=1 Tax=Hylaeus volcanicus TaxID=313075 RepID=UPI0023B7FD44|nr:jouberin-like [Hylaeus volcanicus]
MKKTESIQNSKSVTNLNKKKMELELRDTSIKKKKKRRHQDETNSRSLVINTNKARSRNSDIENSSENSVFVKKTTKEGVGKAFEVFDRNKKFDNTCSTDLEEFATESVNVLVDIHREYKSEKCNDESIRKNENATEVSSKKSESFQIFSRTNNFREEKSKMEPIGYRGLREEQDDIEVVDSIDLIEEFEESSIGETTNERGFRTTRKNKLTTKQADPDLIEGKPRSRRQWDGRKNETEEAKKPARKRWSKDTSVFRLPEVKGTPWTTLSTENVDQRSINQSSQKQRSFSGFDNAAFVSDNEEILRVETDREEARIEMKEIEGNVPEETVGTIEDFNNARDSFVDRFENCNGDAVLDIESVDECNDDDEIKADHGLTKKTKNFHGNGKRNSDDSNTLDSLDATARSDYRSSEEPLVKEDRDRVKKERRRTVITTDDDTAEGNRSRESSNENESRRSIAKRKKSTRKDHRRQSQSEKEKRKSRRKNVSDSSVRSPDAATDSKKKKKKKRVVKYVLVTVHKANTLEIDYVTRHPMVKVHIVKTETGEYLKNESGTRAYLQPAITGKFDFKENRSIVPVWEEELVFEHDFDALLNTDDEQVVILFEIVDLLSFAEASFNYDKFGREGCWHKIAWAFLRPVGKNGVSHIGKMVRLQLYKPKKNAKKLEGAYTCEAYTWWKSRKREKYPSSLFVTVTSIDPPKLEPVLYQQLSLHDLSDVRSESQKASTRTSDLIELPKWTRLAAQSCKIPNEIMFETDVTENGCFFVAFSNDGKYLACGNSEEHDYPIVVYEVETKKVYARFSGHKTFIYSLHWANKDKYLLSVSSDQTARIWDIRNRIVQHVEMMPHPSYVYCGKFAPENPWTVATGCYDRVARIWTRDRKSRRRDLSQELEGHEGFINSMCFQKNSNLLTADSVGTIILWTVKKNRGAASRMEWHISRKIRVREVDGVIINTIVLHPLESRLLVHSRNNGLRLLELATGVVLQKYNELNNQRIQSTACISPCGGLIFCGGEDSTLNVWNLENGSHLAKYTLERNFRAVTCVDYHPHDHVLALSTFGSSAPVRVLRFNKDATGDDVGLKTTEEPRNKVNDSDGLGRFLNAVVTPRERSRSNSRIQTPEEISRERGSQGRRNYKLCSIESSVLKERNDKHTEAKLRLLRLNETERTLKSQSANRLYNIIEKIDRILSNTSRSSGDVESGRNFPLEATKSKVPTSRDENRKSLGYCSTDDRSYFDSSSVERELVELKTLGDRKTSDNIYIDRRAKIRSKSAKEPRSNDPRDHLSKTFSDSAASYRKSNVYNEIVGTGSPKTMETSFVRNVKENNWRKGNSFDNDRSNSSGSTGTYVVEKNGVEVERNSDEDSMKLLPDDDSIQRDVESDPNVFRHSDSGSSISNATFTIENEVPVPKPRRKKNPA